METRLADFISNTPDSARAEEILGKCVHCGFCTATCPTYQLLGDELDSPRGRIYQIKSVLEGAPPTRTIQQHLDRCLTCLNCETTCPSGVRYGQLVEIGKSVVEKNVARPLTTRLFRTLLLGILPYRRRIGSLIRLGQLFRPLLPSVLRKKIYPRRNPGAIPPVRHSRKMLMLNGCAQPAMAPNIDAAMIRVLDRLGISIMATPDVGCCGAVNLHTHDKPTAIELMQANIDAWISQLDQGAEAIVINASGCGAVIKEYKDIFRESPAYAEKAERVSTACKDIVEVLRDENLDSLSIDPPAQAVAFHPPCTLQHAQKLPNAVEQLLEQLGFSVVPVADKHLCCGSAGTYSLFQPDISQQLRDRKLTSLEANAPTTIATANIGCLYHLQSGTDTPVRHWIELLDQFSAAPPTSHN